MHFFNLRCLPRLAGSQLFVCFWFVCWFCFWFVFVLGIVFSWGFWNNEEVIHGLVHLVVVFQTFREFPLHPSFVCNIIIVNVVHLWLALVFVLRDGASLTFGPGWSCLRYGSYGWSRSVSTRGTEWHSRVELVHRLRVSFKENDMLDSTPCETEHFHPAQTHHHTVMHWRQRDQYVNGELTLEQWERTHNDCIILYVTRNRHSISYFSHYYWRMVPKATAIHHWWADLCTNLSEINSLLHHLAFIP